MRIENRCPMRTERENMNDSHNEIIVCLSFALDEASTSKISESEKWGVRLMFSAVPSDFSQTHHATASIFSSFCREKYFSPSYI